MIERLFFDIRLAVRQLLRTPGFSAAAILILGLGIGASTAVFSVVDTILFRALPLPEADRIVTLCEAHEGDRTYCTASPPNVSDWQDEVQALDALGIARSRGVEIHDGTRRTSVLAAMATPGFLRAVGAQPALGRLLGEEDAIPQASGRSILLSWALWQSEFGSDPDIVGRTITMSSGGDGVTWNHDPVTVVGVLTEGFEVPRLQGTRAWIPLQFDARAEQYRGWRGFVALARLARGADLQGAEADLNRIQASLAAVHPDAVRNWSVQVVPLREFVTKEVRALLLLFLGAVAVVLAIVCVNLAGLLVARATKRERELTVRAALGAGRGRLLQHLLAEAGLLALCGGLAGVLMATWLVPTFLWLAPAGIPRMAEVSVDARVLAFSLGITALTGLLFSLAPALRVLGMFGQATLQLGRRSTSDRPAQRMRSALVVSEVALAVTLVLSAALLLRSFARHAAFDPGFDIQRLLTFQVYPPMRRYETREQVLEFYRRAEERLQAVPGVASVGTASAGPLIGGGDGRTPFLVQGRADVPVSDAPQVEWFDAGPGYFPTLGVPIVQGRNLSATDGMGSQVTALVNETMAARYWPGESPVGARLSLPQWETDALIVGVVADVKQFQAPGVEPAIYVSNRQKPRWATFFVVRTTGDPATLKRSVEAAFAELDPEVQPHALRTMEELLGAGLVAPRFNLLLIASFAICALVLSGVGVYAVISYTVALRTQEFGIRMALGARAAQVLAAVLLDGARLIVLGLVIGGVGALYFTRLLRSAIPDIAPSDPAAVAGTVLVLAFTGAIATFAPALRASRTEPGAVLRSD